MTALAALVLCAAAIAVVWQTGAWGWALLWNRPLPRLSWWPILIAVLAVLVLAH